MFPVLQIPEHPCGSDPAGDLERSRQDHCDWRPIQNPGFVSELEEETAATAAQWQRSASNVSLAVAPPTSLTYEQIIMITDNDILFIVLKGSINSLDLLT